MNFVAASKLHKILLLKNCSIAARDGYSRYDGIQWSSSCIPLCLHLLIGQTVLHALAH
jgi:hypothetical protein